MTHHLETVAGFTTAGASTLALWVADVAPQPAEQALQTGGTIGLILGLSWALKTVWLDRKELIAELKKSQEARIEESRASEAARLKDAKDALTQYRADAAEANRTRRELIAETKTQTKAIQEKAP